MSSQNSYLLEVDGLKVHFPLRGSFAERLVGREAGSVKAVDGVSFHLQHGEVLGLVGESGCGKSVTALSMLRLLPPSAEVSGSVRFGGEELLRAPKGPLRRALHFRAALSINGTR